MGQKCEGNCGLWVLNETLKKTYPENLKKKSNLSTFIPILALGRSLRHFLDEVTW